MGLFPVFPREEWQSAKIRAWPKAARRVPRRRLSTPSPVRIGTTSKHLQCSRCAMLAKRLSTELKEQSWHLMDSRPVSTKSLWPICKTNLTQRGRTRNSSLYAKMCRQELLDTILRYEPHHRQASFHGEEV